MILEAFTLREMTKAFGLFPVRPLKGRNGQSVQYIQSFQGSRKWGFSDGVDNLSDRHLRPEHAVDFHEVRKLEVEDAHHDGRVQQGKHLFRVWG